MQSWMQRHLTAVLGAFGALLALALVLIVLLFTQLSSTRDDLDTTRADLERVEAGAALFASQVQGFQEQLVELEPTVSAGIDEAIAGLESFSSSTLEFDVAIDENLPINTEIVIDRTFNVPIKTSIPINESFETTIEVQGPFGLTVPVDVTVPVDIDVPVDLRVRVAGQRDDPGRGERPREPRRPDQGRRRRTRSWPRSPTRSPPDSSRSATCSPASAATSDLVKFRRSQGAETS